MVLIKSRPFDKIRLVAYCILLLVLLIFFFIVYQLNRYDDCNFKTISLKKTKCKFKTGDLLGVSYTTVHGKLVKICTGSMWTHLGMVVCIDQQKYVIEIARYNSTNRGVIIKPLEEWLDWNDGRTLAWRQFDLKKHKFPEEELRQLIKKTKHSSENMNVLTWIKTLYRSDHPDNIYSNKDMRNRRNDKHSYFCTEYICYLLQEIGVMEKDYSPNSYQPWEFVYGKLNTSYGYRYKSPMLLV